jgi:hypothetical protein
MCWTLRGVSVPRYFFAIRWRDEKVEDDPHGGEFPNDAAALAYAERTIRDRQSEKDYDRPELMMVKDEIGTTVWWLPFAPACA